MNVKKSLLIQLVMLVVAIAISTYYLTILPDIVPTHWNIHSQPDQYGSKWVPVLMTPCMVLFGIMLTLALPKMSPKNFEIERFESTFAFSMVLCGALFLFIGIVFTRATVSPHMDIGRMMMSGIFIFFALLGNVMGKIRRNFYMGVRTPWTLADERVWDATHRAAAHQWFVGGLIGAALALAGVPIVVSIVLLMLLAFTPVVNSYVLYRKLVV